MKKIILSLLSIGLFINSFAQDEYKKLPSLGVHFFFSDFKTAADLRTDGFANVLKDKNWSKTSRMNAGLAISYMQGLCNQADFAATISGSFVDYPVPDKPALGSTKFLVDVTAVANLKLLSDKHAVSPYLTLGTGFSKFGGYYGAFIPTGFGLQFNIFDEAFLLINSQYRIPITENVAYHLFYSVGFAGSLSKKKTVETTALPFLSPQYARQ